MYSSRQRQRLINLTPNPDMNEEMKLQEIETILTNNQYNNTISIEDAAQAILAWHNANAQPQLTEAEIEQEATEYANSKQKKQEYNLGKPTCRLQSRPTRPEYAGTATKR